MKKYPGNAPPLAVHFPDSAEREQLYALARQEGRSISNLVQKFIREGMARQTQAVAKNHG